MWVDGGSRCTCKVGDYGTIHMPLKTKPRQAEYETLATHAWRVRTLGGHLLVEVAPGDLTAPPAAESGGVVTVYVNECQW